MYVIFDFVFDLVQLMEVFGDELVIIFSYLFGGMILLQYMSFFFECVKKIVVIEGFGLLIGWQEMIESMLIDDCLWIWIENMQKFVGCMLCSYEFIEFVVDCMQEVNLFFLDEQVCYFIVYGVVCNEDGIYSWKFDNYVCVGVLYCLREIEFCEFWSYIVCLVLFVYGMESWVGDL